jgi:hypothetical protein
VANIPRRVSPRPKSIRSLTVEARLRAESGVFVHSFAAVVAVEAECKVVVAYKTAGRQLAFERHAVCVSETGADGPAACLLKGGGAGRGEDLGVDCGAGGGAGSRKVARVIARRGGLEGDGLANRDGWATGHRGFGVAGGDDVGLDCVLGGVRWVAGGHYAFIKGALARDTIVAADAEEDGAFFAHGIVAAGVWTLAAVEGRQGAGCSIATADRPLVGLSFDDRSEETVCDGRIGRVVLDVCSREEAVLEISHDPWAAASTSAPDGVGTKVDGFHVAIASVKVVGLGVAIVKTASVVVVSAAYIPSAPSPLAVPLAALLR